MTKTPDKVEIVKFLENSKLGKLRYERSPNIKAFHQVQTCLRVKPIVKPNFSKEDDSFLKNVDKKNISRISLNGTIHNNSDKSLNQTDSSLNVFSNKNDSIDSQDSNLLNNNSLNKSLQSLNDSSIKNEKDLTKITEDSLKRLYEKDSKKYAYMKAIRCFEESFEKNCDEILNNSENQTEMSTSLDVSFDTKKNATKDSFELKRQQNLDDILKSFEDINVSFPETEIEIPKPVIVSEIVQTTKISDDVVKKLPEKTSQINVSQKISQIPTAPLKETTPSFSFLQQQSVTPKQVQPPAVNQTSSISKVDKNAILEKPKSELSSLLQEKSSAPISNIFGSDTSKSLFQPKITSETSSSIDTQSTLKSSNLNGSSDVVKDLVSNTITNKTPISEVKESSTVEFSFASTFPSDLEENPVLTPPVIDIKSLSLQNYADVPVEAIYDYYIYHRYILFNKSKIFEEKNSEKAKTIKRSFSAFNKLTETNQKEVLNCLLQIYVTKQCSDGKNTVILNDDDSSFEFAIFRGCFVALNFMISQKFTLILYNLAAVISVLCSRIPLYRDCFLGFLFKQCPYAIPYFPSRKANETKESFLKRCGNLRNMSNEDFQLFIQKNMKLYGAILQMNIPDDKNSLNMFYAWNYVYRFLRSIEKFKTIQSPVSTCIIIEGFLTTCSHRLFERYNRRFTEIFNLIKTVYLPQIKLIEDQNYDLNLQAYHLLLNLVNKIDEVITKQNRTELLRNFDIPDKFFLEYFS